MACSTPVLHSDSVLHYFASDCYWICHPINRMKGVNLCIKIVHLWVLLRKWSIIQTSALVISLAPVSLSLNKIFHACSFLFPFHIFFPFPLNAVGALNEKIRFLVFINKFACVFTSVLQHKQRRNCCSLWVQISKRWEEEIISV